jgi:hypothetical protein
MLHNIYKYYLNKLYIKMDLPEDAPITVEEETDKTKRLYPNLIPTAPRAYDPKIRLAAQNIYQEPTHPGFNKRANDFRLHKINEVQKVLEAERDKRSTLAKKYQRGINVMSGIAYGLEVATVGLGTAGVALLTTVVATPVVIAMEGVALSAGGLSVTFNLICDKVLSSKNKKHLQIKMFAESKLNTINDHISKALKDGYITDDEFTLILSELDKFYKMKDEIKNKTITKIDDETKKSLILEGKNKAIEEFQSMFTNRVGAGHEPRSLRVLGSRGGEHASTSRVDAG